GEPSGKLMKPCDDEDCIEGSGSNGEDITEPDHGVTTAGVSSTHSMTSPTVAISTEHIDKTIQGSTDAATDTTGATGSTKSDTTLTRHTESTHTTDSEHIPDYEDHRHDAETHSPYDVHRVPSVDRTPAGYPDDGDRLPGYPGYNGHDPEITTKWYHPKTTDNKVVPQPSEFLATLIGIVCSILIIVIVVVIIALKLVFRVDTSYKVTEDKNFQQGANAALLANQVLVAHSSYQTGANNGGAVRNLQPLPLRNGAALAPQPVKRDGIKEWYV
ncbi:unnamed protein product, partial [Leptidea sinapis]